MSSRRRARASSTSMTMAHAVVHGHRERLRAAHPAEPGRQRDGPAQRPAEVLAGGLGEGLVRALQDALGPDVDPRARGHLAVHHQAAPLEVAEDLPGRPLADEVRVGDEDPRRPRMRAHDPDRLARLDEQRLVVAERAELADDRVEGVPAPRGAAGPAVDDEVVRVLGDLRIEVVHEHPEGRLLLPAAAGQLGAARGADGAWAGHRARAYSCRSATICSPSPREPSDGDRHHEAVGEVDVVGRGAARAGPDEDVATGDGRALRTRRRRPPARRRPGRRPRGRSRGRSGCRRPGRSWTTLATARSSPFEPPGATTIAIAIASAFAARVGSAATVAAVAGSGASANPGPTRAGGRAGPGRRRSSGRRRPAIRRGSRLGVGAGVAVGRRGRIGRHAVDRHAAGQDRGQHGDREEPRATRASGAGPAAPHAGQASSRRMTGNRSSATARANPAAQPERRGRGARRVGPGGDLGIGLDRGEAAAPRGRRRPRRPAAGRARPPRAAAVVAMQVMTAGSGASGQRRVQVARALRPRVGGQRAELAVRRRDLVREAGPWRSCRRPSGRGRGAASLRGASASAAGGGGRRRGERVRRRPASTSSRNGFAGRRSAGGANGFGPRGGRVGAREERVGRGGPAGRGARARPPPATPAGPPSTRGRRPPSSRRCGGRSPGPRTAGCARNPASSSDVGDADPRVGHDAAESTAGIRTAALVRFATVGPAATSGGPPRRVSRP